MHGSFGLDSYSNFLFQLWANPYYHCTRKRPCTQRTPISEADLEQQFADLLGSYTILPQFKDWALHELAQQNEIEGTDIQIILTS